MKDKIKSLAKKSKGLTKLYNHFIRNRKMDSIEEIVKQYYNPSQKKKIILIGHSGGLGGAEVLLKNMIQEFLNQDYEVVVLVRGKGPIIPAYQEMAPTFVIDTLEKNEQYILKLKDLGYHSAILNTITNGDLIPLLKQNEIHVIELIHELPGVIHALHCEERASIIASQADLVVFPSSFVKEKFETIASLQVPFQIQPQGLYMVYDKWDRTSAREFLFKEYGISKKQFVVLNVGLGEKRKGFDLFIKIALKMKEEKAITFVWLGTIHQELEEELKEQMAELPNLVLPGYISDKEVFMKFYDACDLFLLTSREDPFPSVVLEAFNASKPVLAFQNAGGFQDIVKDDQSGYLVEYENVDAMIEKIKELKKNNKKRRKLGEGAKKMSDAHRFVDYIESLGKECR